MESIKGNVLSLLVGGLLPAILFGVSGVVQKTSTKAGIGTGPFLVVVGVVVVLIGGIFTAVERDTTVNWSSGFLAGVFGVLWASGIGSIAIALGRYEGQISQLVPLYNMNTLVAVVIGLVALSEWQTVQPGRLLLGAVLTVAGGVLAATSAR
jgi:uncharacterized membrane protein